MPQSDAWRAVDLVSDCEAGGSCGNPTRERGAMGGPSLTRRAVVQQLGHWAGAVARKRGGVANKFEQNPRWLVNWS